MAYTKQTWQDLPSKTTPINASRLGHIEQGIYDAADTADTAASNASSALSGLDDKVDKIVGKGLSTNDFTDALQTKLNNIEAGAEVNVQSDWSQSDNSADDYIKNKPSLGTSAYKNSTSVVTDSTDLVESGAVRDIVGWGNKNLLPITLDRLKALNTAGTWSGNVYTLNNVTFEIQTNDNEVTAIKLSANNASANTNLVINALANPYKIGNGSNITYTVNQFPTTFALQVDVYENGEYKSTLQSRAEDQTKTYSGNITIGVARIRVFASATISETLIYPQLEKGSTATTYEPYHASVSDSLAEKCDNSVIGTVEGANASKSWSVGEHFIKDGQFKEVTQAIASGGDINSSNTVDKPIADCLVKEATFSGTTNANGQISITNTTDRKVIKVVLNTNFLICLLYQRSDGESIKVVDANLQPWAEQAISGTYYYID